MTSETERVNDEHLRPILVDLLSQCTKAQQDLFARMYPDGVEGLAGERIPHAIRQCERTIENNAKPKK